MGGVVVEGSWDGMDGGGGRAGEGGSSGNGFLEKRGGRGRGERTSGIPVLALIGAPLPREVSTAVSRGGEEEVTVDIARAFVGRKPTSLEDRLGWGTGGRGRVENKEDCGLLRLARAETTARLL